MSSKPAKPRPIQVPAPARARWQAAVISFILCAGVILVFGRTFYHDFVNYDDTAYVYENPVVAKGLTLEGVGWAFTHVHADNWHPLTTLSHMLDCQLFGLNPAGHHLHNVLLHALASVLLFLMLRELTGATWRSAFVAALFAIHPLRVESVAWVAERKDVLSGVFFMLTLRAYARFVRHPASRKSYALVLLWFALGLMSKPMLVTVPFVLLLLDYWPLKRLQMPSQLPGLLREKWPLFVLSALSCVATVIAQQGAIQPLDRYPFPLRLENALVACAAYLGKWVWPVDLAVLYPVSKEGWSAWQVGMSVLLLLSLSAGAWLLRRKQPFLVAGWLWFLGMLVPVIGILQVGAQAYADRYTYLPQIGLGLAGTWAVATAAEKWRYRQAILGILAAVILAVFSAAAFVQASLWRDSTTLWTHALQCTADNATAHNNLGNALCDQGKIEESMAECLEAIRINPEYAEAYYNLGNALLKKGRSGEAAARYLEAVRIRPHFADARYNLGNVFLEQGKIDEAMAQFLETLDINPAYAKAHNNLGTAFLRKGMKPEAMAHYRTALELDPTLVESHNNFGTALLQEGKIEEAIAHYREALRFDPGFAKARNNLGTALYIMGMSDEAIDQTQKAVELQPGDRGTRRNLAWMLATAPNDSLRNGPRAVQLAGSAIEDGNPASFRILAAAQAQAGDFPNAVRSARKALSMAEAQSSTILIASLRRELQLYQAGKPFQSAH